MTKIVRTATKVTGGVTDDELARMRDHSALWINQAFRTDPIEPDKIVPAIERLYAAAGLKKPRVVIAPSPLVMAFAYGAAAAIWSQKSATRRATRIATRRATEEATGRATEEATYSATYRATYRATEEATGRATDNATYSATDNATGRATYSATDNATGRATDNATRNATRIATARATDEATRRATEEATIMATEEATEEATGRATRRATYSATIMATYSATHIATRRATDSATDIATDEATYSATDIATVSATYSATYSATDIATDSATEEATEEATRSATDIATDEATIMATEEATNGAEYGAASACFDLAGDFGLTCAQQWSSVYQGGNMWAGYDCYITAYRDILGLKLPEHYAYAAWEQAAIHGGFRVMHQEFCIVSDFPEHILVDEQNRPHCADGPSHKWRDGWSLYHWHGVRIPDDWVGSGLDAKTAVTWPNVEQRRAAIEILGWQNVLSALDAKSLGGNPDPKIGELIEVQLPFEDNDGNATTRALFLKAQCGTGRTIFEAVDPDEIDIDPRFDPAWCAQAWRDGYSPADWLPPSFRT